MRTGWPLTVAALVWSLAFVAHAEERTHRSRHHEDDSAESSDGDESRESARERRKRRREEREARKRAEEQAAAGTQSADPPPPPAPGPKGKPTPLPATAEAPGPVRAPSLELVPLLAVEEAPVYSTREVLAGEGPLDPHKVPASYAFELASSPVSDLRRFDARVAETVDALQASERCESLRGASRVPFRTWLWREHQRELVVAVGLFVLAFFAGFAWPSPTMRAIAPMLPLIGCAYVGYDGATRTTEFMESITRGLRACSTALEEGSPEKPTVVRGHVEQLTRMAAQIDAAYERENSLVARVMQEYKM